MRKVWTILAALIFTTSAYAAEAIGTLACTTAQGGSLTRVKVSLLEGNRIKKYKTLKGADLLPPGQIIEFTATTSAFTLTGLRLDCDFGAAASDPTWKTLKTHQEGEWKTLTYPVPANYKLKIGVRVFEKSIGVFQVEIGNQSPEYITPSAAATVAPKADI